MGFMTEFSILNDGCSLIKENPVEFANKIYDACIDVHSYRKYQQLGYYPTTYSMGLGNFVNMITASTPHHADDRRIYISGRNSFDCLSYASFDKSLQNWATRFPDILDDIIKFLSDELKDLKNLRKKIKEEQTNS